MKGPEELLFLEIVSRVLGAIAFDDVNSIFRSDQIRLEQIWKELHWSATRNCYELNYFLFVYFDKK